MRKAPFIFICTYILIRFILLPVQHTGDGWGYACEILKGDFFAPHHLLHKPLMFGLLKFVQIFNQNVDPITLFSAVNLIFSGLVLYVFYLILNHFSGYHQMNFWLLFLVAFSFGFIRYSSENETYIVPLFFSLWGSYAFLRGKFYLGYFLMSLAVLFHQIHIFWLLAFFVPQKNKKIKWKFLLISVVFITFFYVSYAFFYNKKWYSLPFYDVSEGLVETIPGIMNFVLTPINFIRSFIQIHGSMKPILFEVETKYLSLLLIGICFTFCFLKYRSIIWLFKKIITQIDFKSIEYRNVFFVAFCLHVVFAFYSVGNAEFMVMLPFLLILWQYSNLIKMSLKGIHYFGMILLFWNLSFYLIPYSYTDFNHLSSKIDELDNVLKIHHLESGKGLVITSNNILWENYCEYNRLTKKSTSNHLMISPQELNSNHSKYSWYLTDEINLHEHFDRKSMIQKNKNCGQLLKNMNFAKVSESFYLSYEGITNSNLQNQ